MQTKDQHQNTHALIAGPAATTRTTDSTATAPGVVSTPQKRIDDYVRIFSQEANSENFSSLKHTAEAVTRLGFKNSANSRYVGFLEAFRQHPRLTDQYREKYPACCFLGWNAFHALRRALDLWCELPEFYAGAVPAAQVPWMDIFELQQEDSPSADDLADLVELPAHRDRHDFEFTTAYYFGLSYLPRTPTWDSRESIQLDTRRLMRKAGEEFRSSFFVMAPKEAFTTATGGQDWLERTKRLTTAQTSRTEAPDDPLVIRFCREGCLVVAAWGDEAAVLNQAVKDLKL